MNTFIVEAKLNVRPFQHYALLKAFKYELIVYNRLLSFEKKKLDSFFLNDEVSNLRIELSKTKNIKKIKCLKSSLNKLRKDFSLTRFDIIKDVKRFYKEYKDYISSQIAQSIAKRLDGTILKVIEDKNAELLHKKKMNSIESESITNGIKYDGSNVIYKDMYLPVRVNKSSYFKEAMNKYDLKYIRIVRRLGKTKSYYVAQFVFKGDPVSLKHIRLGEGNVGIDIGTSTIAICSNEKVYIEELSKEIDKTTNKINEINLLMERSRRANNPDNYNEDGTIKKELKPWKNSNNYRRLRRKRRYLSRKVANQRKNLYEKEVNNLLLLGERFIVEPMDYKALQQRSKETLKDEKGRFLKKARYGKSIGNHAPSLFLSILSRKLNYLQKDLHKVNMITFKASQYDHIKDEYIKCDLNTRIKDIGGHKVQRDLYSAFLLMNADDNLEKADIKKCNDNFERFLSLHEIEIKRLSKQTNISCIGI